MARPRVIVIGAGLAGLAAARSAAAEGAQVTVFEASGQAGGRCRSFDDARLGLRLDNGAHIVLGANKHVFRYLADLGARDRLTPVAGYPMRDLASGRRWRWAPGPGPFWHVAEGEAPPGASLRAVLAAAPLLWARHKPVAAALGRTGQHFASFWDPLTTAALNTAPAEADPVLLRRTLAAGFLRGPRGAQAWLARQSLDETFVAPALSQLARNHVRLHFKSRVQSLDIWNNRAKKLVFGNRASEALTDADAVVLAVPPTAARALLPHLHGPKSFNAICNIHYRLPDGLAPARGFLGLLGSPAQWLFVRGDVVTVTISAADSLMGEPPGTLAARLWPDIRAALDLPEETEVPPYRVVKERRATIAQTPGHMKHRPPPDAPGLANLVLAGDWTRTGLPASLEGAIRSGHRATALLKRRGFL